MWALTKQLITNPEALALLSDWKKRGGLHSDAWLLPRSVALFGTKARPSAAAPLTIPAALLVDSDRQLSAVPFASLPFSFRTTILSVAPPPAVNDSLPVIVEAADGSIGAKPHLPFRPADLRWRESTLEELFDAALPDCSASVPQEKLLCSASLAPDPLPRPDTLTLLNAQDTLNPFAVDPQLAHRDGYRGEVLPGALFSSLTTIACQFHYRCLQWLEVVSRSECSGSVAAALDAGVKPHLVVTREPILLAHLSQLPLEEQQALIAAAPRYILFKAAASACVLQRGRWLPAFRLDLERKLRHQDIPPLPLRDVGTQPLLWVELEEADVAGIAGNALRLTRLAQRSFLNMDQLRPWSQEGSGAVGQ